MAMQNINVMTPTVRSERAVSFGMGSFGMGGPEKVGSEMESLPETKINLEMIKSNSEMTKEGSEVTQNEAEVPEFNTDQGNGTHIQCRSLFEGSEGQSVPEDLLAHAHRADPRDLHALFCARREVARRFALDLAAKAQAQRLSLAEGIFSILDKRGVRRGTAKSAKGRSLILTEIEAALARPGPLTLAVLTFPFRDQHPFKNVGQIADAGEVEAIIRLWTIGTAIKALGVDCKVIALRDGNRYPCTWHINAESKRNYGDSFRDFVEALSLGDCLEVRDIDDRTESETIKEYELRMQSHQAMFEKELAGFMEQLEEHRGSILSAVGEAEFIERLSKLPSGNVLVPMFWPILHWSPPCATPESTTVTSRERHELMHRLITVFQPQPESSAEENRKELLWQALVGAAQYVSAYRSRSAANNELSLDDVSAVAPGALRMSIHNKSKDNGAQFPIQVGGNVHRTPWHGTAELRFSKQEGHAVFDTKLAAEMWWSHVPVVPHIAGMESDASPEMKAWIRYCARFERANQPLFFAEDKVTLTKGDFGKVMQSNAMERRSSLASNGSVGKGVWLCGSCGAATSLRKKACRLCKAAQPPVEVP